MKAVILAGGIGSRLSEETHLRPKPMVEVDGKPILWHIMKIYSAHGVRDFVICLGYKGYMIKEYFSNYFLHMSDVTFDMQSNQMEVHQKKVEPWRVTLVDTGYSTMTGGRLKAVREYLDDEPFHFTYGDGVSDVNVRELQSFHSDHGLLASMTVVRPPGRYGAVAFDDHRIGEFVEKPEGEKGWINGGFFILSPRVLDYIDGPETSWEGAPLQTLAAEGQLAGFKHAGFWQPMDTLREKQHLEQLAASGKAPWQVWD